MEILSFDIIGKFAHFRKYYANNTAMSFSLPPRTTIIGIIAGALGLPKDSYYEDFKSENIRIGINILTQIKKSFHRVNLLKIKGVSDFRGREQHIQTPFEVVSGINPAKDEVKYRIFVSANEKGTDLFKKMKKIFLDKKFIYSATLGTANFLAHIENVHIYSESSISFLKIKDEYVTINSACLSENVNEIKFEKDNSFRFNMIEEELLPADFKANNYRELSKMNRILFSSGNIPLKVKFSGTLYSIKEENKVQTIQFLD
ncbi:MAG: CRISPR-associated protein Cas5 [Bacteroidota bacterium]|nr:CRISPR-associated protein Cas5 [Bacteroidota bacterium]